MKRRHLISYSRLDRTYPRVYEPKSVAELQQLLTQAKTENWSVTLRGGGYSFDSQSLNDQVVISLHHLHHIKSIDQQQAQITVEPAVRWGHIVRQLLPLGLTPHIVVTTGQATAGGTLSANCLSRNSARYGKDGKHVLRFQLLTMDGHLLECSPTENSELFHAVIGGFGYLGAVTEITYNLLHIGERTQVQTVIHKYTSLESLVAGLKQHMQELQSWDAVYAVAFFSGEQDKGYVCRSRYSAEKQLKRFFLYFGINPIRILFEWLSRITWIETLALNIAFRYFTRDNQSFLDKFEGYTFFMESDRLSKEIASRFRVQLPTIQQTFIIPEANLLAFLTPLSHMLRKKQLIPNMLDIVPIPADDFLMSASNGLNGFAVSVAFEDLNIGNIVELIEVLHALSTVCSQLGGRVHLVKNVYATPEQLQTMYGQSMELFLRLKKKVDPEGILRNSFFERIFGYDQSPVENQQAPV